MVTGVSSGLGEGIVRAFVDAQWTVVGVARREDRLQQLAASLQGSGGEFLPIAADVSRVADCRRVIASALDTYGHIDALICNAAVQGPIKPAHTVTEAEWQLTLDTNLKGPFFLCASALQHMRVRKSGVILNIASIAAVIGIANMIPYNSSKAALVHMTQSIAVEAAADGVRANAIIVGGVRSEMSEPSRVQMGRVLRGEDWTPHTATSNLLRPPREVAEVIVALCSEEFRLVTGAQIAIDGAISAGLLSSTLMYLSAAELLN